MISALVRIVRILIAVTSLIVSGGQLSALEGVNISIQQTNVVLHWGSTGKERYLIQYRGALDASDQWVNLVTNYPAAASTNRTSYVILGAVPPPAGGGGGGGSGGGDPPPLPGASAMSSTIGVEDNGISYPLDETTVEYLAEFSVFPPYDWDTEGRAPYVWELAARPPLPWEFKSFWKIYEEGGVPPSLQAGWDYFQALEAAGFIPPQSYDLSSDSLFVSQVSSAQTQTASPIGFYRVFKESPTAVSDIFPVQQDSTANQLNIFANNFAPDDAVFFLSNLTPAAHGVIEYTDNASIFRYTPTAGFFGVDSFTYSVTNRLGAGEAATVTVFVNKTGNQPPAAPHPLITLETNVSSTNINAFAGATDPNGDAISFVGVATPKWGTVVTNTSGVITYTRDKNYFSQDSFDYFLSDGRGGLTPISVEVALADNDIDGLSDLWEAFFGLNLASDDSNADPDGDGASNLAELLLRSNPRVPDSLLSLEVSSGATLAGFAQVPLIGLNPEIAPPPVTLYVNDEPAANSFLTQRADGQWLINWDTTFLNNGGYSIKAGFQFNSSPTLGATSIFGAAKAVLVANDIQFDQLTTTFTDFLLIDATLARTDADYRVELYDDAGNPLVYAEGTTTNGKIQIYWDLTDGNGNQLSFGNIESRFYIAEPGGLNGKRQGDHIIQGVWRAG